MQGGRPSGRAQVRRGGRPKPIVDHLSCPLSYLQKALTRYERKHSRLLKPTVDEMIYTRTRILHINYKYAHTHDHACGTASQLFKYE